MNKHRFISILHGTDINRYLVRNKCFSLHYNVIETKAFQFELPSMFIVDNIHFIMTIMTTYPLRNSPFIYICFNTLHRWETVTHPVRNSNRCLAVNNSLSSFLSSPFFNERLGFRWWPRPYLQVINYKVKFYSFNCHHWINHSVFLH